jgi:hypothetical protein
VYSHGSSTGLMPNSRDVRKDISAAALGQSLRTAGIAEALILGCFSKGLAERAADAAGGTVRIGGIEPERSDHVDEHRTNLDIARSIIWDYPRP